MGEDDLGERGDVKKTPPPSYDDVVEMKNVVKVKEADNIDDSNKKSDGVKDEKEKKDENKDKPAEPEDPPVGVFELVKTKFKLKILITHLLFQFKYATPLDTFLIIFGLLVSLAMGAAMPILCILFGDTLQVRKLDFLIV